MQSEDDLYEILQVSPAAEVEVIEAAYKRLALKYHPDRSGVAGSGERMQRLNAAYEVLRDPARRAAYDLRRAVPLADIEDGGEGAARTTPRSENGESPTSNLDPPRPSPTRRNVASPGIRAREEHEGVGRSVWVALALFIFGLAVLALLLSRRGGPTIATPSAALSGAPLHPTDFVLVNHAEVDVRFPVLPTKTTTVKQTPIGPVQVFNYKAKVGEVIFALEVSEFPRIALAPPESLDGAVSAVFSGLRTTPGVARVDEGTRHTKNVGSLVGLEASATIVPGGAIRIWALESAPRRSRQPILYALMVLAPEAVVGSPRVVQFFESVRQAADAASGSADVTPAPRQGPSAAQKPHAIEGPPSMNLGPCGCVRGDEVCARRCATERH